jgi:hypothetical protein
LLLGRETAAQGNIAARCKQAGWNDDFLLKVLSNWNTIALLSGRTQSPGEALLVDLAGCGSSFKLNRPSKRVNSTPPRLPAGRRR